MNQHYIEHYYVEDIKYITPYLEKEQSHKDLLILQVVN